MSRVITFVDGTYTSETGNKYIFKITNGHILGPENHVGLLGSADNTGISADIAKVITIYNITDIDSYKYLHDNLRHNAKKRLRTGSGNTLHIMITPAEYERFVYGGINNNVLVLTYNKKPVELPGTWTGDVIESFSDNKGNSNNNNASGGRRRTRRRKHKRRSTRRRHHRR